MTSRVNSFTFLITPCICFLFDQPERFMKIIISKLFCQRESCPLCYLWEKVTITKHIFEIGVERNRKTNNPAFSMNYFWNQLQEYVSKRGKFSISYFIWWTLSASVILKGKTFFFLQMFQIYCKNLLQWFSDKSQITIVHRIKWLSGPKITAGKLLHWKHVQWKRTRSTPTLGSLSERC